VRRLRGRLARDAATGDARTAGVQSVELPSGKANTAGWHVQGYPTQPDDLHQRVYDVAAADGAVHLVGTLAEYDTLHLTDPDEECPGGRQRKRICFLRYHSHLPSVTVGYSKNEAQST
jgi:hypothetical protein